MAKVNVLHLSDLHFGVESSDQRSVTALSQRKNTLDGIIRVLKDLDPKWRPEVVIISGDIAWSGCEQDYSQAREWIEDVLLKALGLSVENLVVCAGNHDINRKKTIGMGLPRTFSEADDWLSVESLENFVRLFEDYNKFCDEFKIPELSIGEDKYQLVGQRVLKGLRFVVLNSAWFCRGDKDKGKLWIGLPQLKVMNSESQLVKPEKYDNKDEPITISILHHPPEWLDGNEINSYNERPNTFRYLSERSHIILAGHVHAAIEEPDRKYNSAYLFKGGTTYSGDDYRNNFSIYQIDKKSRTFKRCVFEFKPDKDKWSQEESEPLSLLKQKTTEVHQVQTTVKFEEEINSYCEKAVSIHARLPVAGFVTQLKVPIDIEEIYVPLRAMLNLSGKDEIFANADHAEKRMVERDKAEIHLPDAFKEARERNKRKGIVILGDPGSGKTTHLKRLLLACLREGSEKLNLPSDVLPVFLPIRELKDLDKGLDAFIQQQLASPHLDTKEGFGKRLLDCKNLLFLLDGLDEVADLEQRERVAGWILESITARPTCYFVVTCRFAGYSPTVHMNENFLEMYIRPFNNDEVDRFVHNWYKTVE
ncbi:MAG: NACHT domain-containing protein, partial [Candidatus Brocadiaceae bacterium]|nr:NACHT domain-containing protein [Candidatus Brocadiaceae bacterium]